MKIVKNILEIIIALIALVFFSGNVTKFMSNKVLHSDYINAFGYTYFFIEDDKMSPDLENGNVIIVDIGSDVKEGDIVTYYDAKIYKTSKVVSIDDDRITTRDSQSSTNNQPIIKEQIIGKTVHTIKDGTKVKKYLDNKLYIKWLGILIVLYLIINVIDTIIDSIIRSSKGGPTSSNSVRVNGNRFIKK